MKAADGSAQPMAVKSISRNCRTAMTRIFNSQSAENGRSFQSEMIHDLR